MGFIDYSRRPRVLIVGNGHTYDRTALMAMFESFEGKECFLVEHPLAEEVLNPTSLADVDVLVLYHMPGGNVWDGPGYEVPPTEKARAGFLALLDAGMPILALHHAIGAWSLWPDYAEALGGILLHAPGVVRGRPVMDSGYRQEARYRITAEDPGHPLFRKLPPSFEIQDETYAMEVFTDSITPVARSDWDYSSASMHSLALAMTGERRSNRGWSRPTTSNIMVWTRQAGNSPLAYIQPGHDARTYADPNYRQLVLNGLDWALDEGELWRNRNGGG